MEKEMQPFDLDTWLVNFVPLPKDTIGTGLSSTATVLYALLVDRATLSRKSGWANKDGLVYVIYPIDKLAQTLGRGTTAVKKCLNELEKGGLIRRERHGRTAPNHIYLFVPRASKQTVAESENHPSESRKTDRVRAAKPPTNKQREQTNLANYYQYQEDESL